MQFQAKVFSFHICSLVLANLTQPISGEGYNTEVDNREAENGDRKFKEHEHPLESICSSNFSDAKYRLIGATTNRQRIRKFTCFSPTPITWKVEFDSEIKQKISGQPDHAYSTPLPYSVTIERRFCNEEDELAGKEYFTSSLYFDATQVGLNSHGTYSPRKATVGCTNQNASQGLYIEITRNSLKNATKAASKRVGIDQCSERLTVDSDNIHSRFTCKSTYRYSHQVVSLTSCYDWTNCIALANFITKEPCQRILLDDNASYCHPNSNTCTEIETKNVSGMLSCQENDLYTSFLPFFRHKGVFRYVEHLSGTLTDEAVSKLGVSLTQINILKDDQSIKVKISCSAPKFIAVSGFHWTFGTTEGQTLKRNDVCAIEQGRRDPNSYTEICSCMRCGSPTSPLVFKCNVFLQTGHYVTVTTIYPLPRTTATTTSASTTVTATTTTATTETNAIASASHPGIAPIGVAPSIPPSSSPASSSTSTTAERLRETSTEGWKSTAIIFGAGVGACFLLLLPILVFYRRKVGRQRNALQISKDVHDNFIHGIEMMNTLAANKQQPALVLPYDYNLEIPRDQIKIDSKPLILGEGVFGKVVKASIAGRFVAIKTCKPTPDGQPLKALLSELKIMSFVGKHPNIVELVGANTERLKKQDVWMIFELCENGNALHYIRGMRNIFVNQLSEDLLSYKHVPSMDVEYANASTKKLCSEDLVRWSYEVACGMDYIASKNVYHGDLAARNILLTRGLVAKVGDFGLAKQLTDYSLYVQRIECPLPLKWLSIESLRDLEFSIQSDVWSFGIAVWELFSLGSTPYPGMDWNFQAWKNLQDGERMDRPECATQSTYRILRKCWETLPQDRPTFGDIKDKFRHELDSIGAGISTDS